MRGIAVVVLALAVALMYTQVFAGEGKGCKPCGGKSIFQMMYDCIKKPCHKVQIGTDSDVKEANKEMEAVKNVKVFQNMADGIKEGSAKAKQESIR